MPKILVFFITYRCNARCIMCSIWQKEKDFKELDLNIVEKIFHDTIFTKNLEIINITGGEPTLHPHFDEVIKIIVKNCPGLKRIDIPTNGLDTDIIKDKIQQALGIIFPYSDVKLTLTVSVDGVNEIYDKIRGVRNGFEKVKNTIRELKELQDLYPNLSLSLNTVIIKSNYDRLEGIRNFAKKEGLYLNYTLGAISEIGVESIVQKERFYLDSVAEKKEVINFLRKIIKEKEISFCYVKFLINFLKSGKRKAGCAFKEGKAVLLDANGRLYACGNYKGFYIGDLTKNSFSEILKGCKIPRNYWQMCKKCESNCYWDED